MRVVVVGLLAFIAASATHGAAAADVVQPIVVAPGQSVSITIPVPASTKAPAVSASAPTPAAAPTPAPAASSNASNLKVLVQTQQQEPGVLSQGNAVGTVRYALHAVLADDGKTPVCIPHDTPVIARPHPNDPGTNEVVIDNGRTYVFAWHVLDPDKDVADCDPTDPKKTIDRNKAYLAPTQEVSNTVTYGQMVMGVLVVPYKYYINGDRSFVGNPSLAGYIGSRTHNPEYAVDSTFAFIAGVTTVNVPSTSTSSTSGSNTITTTTPQNSTQGYTVGLGWFWSFGKTDSAQAGFMVGQDYVSKNLNWVNNGKTWVAIDVAYQFE